MEEYIIICFPESKHLKNMSGFNEHCRIVKGNRGVQEFGKEAYLVPVSWYNNPHGSGNVEIGEVFDKELEALYLM